MGFFFDQKSRPTVRTISIHRRAASATYGLRPKVEELRSSTLRSRACGVWGRWRWWTAQHGTSHTRDDRVAKRSRRTVATVEGVLRIIHGYVPATTTLRVRGRSSGVITTSSPHTLPTHRKKRKPSTRRSRSRDGVWWWCECCRRIHPSRPADHRKRYEAPRANGRERWSCGRYRDLFTPTHVACRGASLLNLRTKSVGACAD